MTEVLDHLRWRLVGPFRGGRVVAVAGHPTKRLTFYFGSTGGGVWKTDDGGRTWSNTSDGFFHRASVGALSIAAADPSVMYAGMGEACLRNTVAHGDGIYRSADGGRTWEHRGLEPTRHIGRVRVDPRDPDLVYVAALGHAHGPNPERGVYRTHDGGRTWELVLHRGEDAGAVDLCLDPENPRLVYATTWRVRRRPWRLDSGGDGSGLWRSDDGGDSWVELTRKPGMPAGAVGRIGVSASPARPGRLWCIVESEQGGVFMSDDWGEHWTRTSTKGEVRERPFYYSHIVAHPCDPDTVWCLATDAWRSIDGGRNFDKVDVQHGDTHDLWIDPADPDRLILGDDGGANVSFDGGRSFSSILNQPTAELYHVTTDTRRPYRVYACQQDNTSLSLATHSETGAITVRDMYTVGGGEAGHIAVRPDDPDIVYATEYGGEITRHDHGRMTTAPVWVWPDVRRGGAEEYRYRFNWTSPIIISPHDPNVLYMSGNIVFRTTDGGQTWTPVSPDLTRNDPEKQRSSGGPLTQDNSGAEYWCTVFTLAESPLARGLLWAGSDDGLVHVTEDGGDTWRSVTPADMPEWATVSIVEPSAHDALTAYLAVDRHRLDDFQPYLYRTRDLGATWERIDDGIPDGEFCRVIREDPMRRGLLVAGTEAGVYVSYDDGAHWRSCRANLPVVPVHDLRFKGDDLVVATHGRSIWILDDLPIVRGLDASRAAGDGIRVHPPRTWVRLPVYEPLPPTAKAESGPRRSIHWTSGTTINAVETRPHRDRPDAEPRFLDAGENAPHGVVVYYELPEPGDRTLTLTFLDEDGRELRVLTTTPKDEELARNGDNDRTKPEPWKREEPHPPRRRGVNRSVWNGRRAPAPPIEAEPYVEDLIKDFGPPAPPGAYEVRVRLGDDVARAPFRIDLDPRDNASPADITARQDLMLRLFDRLSVCNRTVTRLRRIRQSLSRHVREADGAEAAPDDVSRAATELRDALRSVEDRLSVSDVAGRSANQLRLAEHMRLDDRITYAILALNQDWGPVPQSTREVGELLITELDAAVAEAERLLTGPLVAFEERLRVAGISALDVPRPA